MSVDFERDGNISEDTSSDFHRNFYYKVGNDEFFGAANLGVTRLGVKRLGVIRLGVTISGSNEVGSSKVVKG